MIKIGVLTGPTLSEIDQEILHPILNDQNISVEIYLINSSPSLSFKKKIKKNIKRGRGGYILVMGLQKLFSKSKNNVLTKRYCQEKDIPFLETDKPYSIKTINTLKKYNLDVLILLGGYGIIKKPLLRLCPNGILSYHGGDMRKYRGMPSGFWELYNGETEMGITVQKLAVGLDKGIPIEEKNINILKNDTLKSLTKKVLNEKKEMMHSAILKISDENFKPTVISTFGKIYTLPNLKQWLNLQFKIIARKSKYLFLK